MERLTFIYYYTTLIHIPCLRQSLFRLQETPIDDHVEQTFTEWRSNDNGASRHEGPVQSLIFGDEQYMAMLSALRSGTNDLHLPRGTATHYAATRFRIRPFHAQILALFWHTTMVESLFK